MGSMWKRAVDALRLYRCVAVPPTEGEKPSDSIRPSSVDSASSTGLPSTEATTTAARSEPSTPVHSHSSLRRLRSTSRHSRRTCAICLDAMKPGHGHALFTSECSHTFHFSCIASNVKHGNRVCPVCRAKWKEVPFQGPPAEPLRYRARINTLDWPREEGWTTVLRGLPPPQHPLESARHGSMLSSAVEPSTYADDEPLDPLRSGEDRSQGEVNNDSNVDEVDRIGGSSGDTDSRGQMPQQGSRGFEVREHDYKYLHLETFPEFAAIPHSEGREKFTVLVHLKAPLCSAGEQHNEQDERAQGTRNPQILDTQRDRAAIDLVTVLDVSGSMAGTKLALLKRAMGFVIQNLGPTDRLSVIAFSSTARRLFPLRCMSEGGRQQALQAVNALVSTGGTNIAEGLKKGAKVLEDRRQQNPVSSIILLSDGQDTYNVGNHRQLPDQSNPRGALDYHCLLPESVRLASQHGHMQIPVHTFGFGSDHDSASMHSISETSGGTFSFIEAENVIQDAFAQCIGGLLSVVVQDVQVIITCANSEVQISAIQAGSYVSDIAESGQQGLVKLGNLYAEEERDFLVHVKLPIFSRSANSTSLDEMKVLKVASSYKDPVSQETMQTPMNELLIRRPNFVSSEQQISSREVDRQRNRLCTAEAIAEAKALADRGDFRGAQLILGNRRMALQASPAAQAGDQLCCSLDAELKEMQERMANRQLYESSGRAYVLSGLSSHSWQRATTRGDSSDSVSLVYGYQTPTMIDMLMRSQATCPVPRDVLSRSLLPARSFPLPEARSSHQANDPESIGAVPLHAGAWMRPSERALNNQSRTE